MLESVTTQILTDDTAQIQKVAIDRGEAVGHTIRYLLRLGLQKYDEAGLGKTAPPMGVRES